MAANTEPRRVQGTQPLHLQGRPDPGLNDPYGTRKAHLALINVQWPKGPEFNSPARRAGEYTHLQFASHLAQGAKILQPSPKGWVINAR